MDTAMVSYPRSESKWMWEWIAMVLSPYTLMIFSNTWKVGQTMDPRENSTTKCIYSKTCERQLFVGAENGDFVCAGHQSKPDAEPLDNIQLCLMGELLDKPRKLQMTKQEAGFIISVLSMAVANTEEGLVPLNKEK
jgi:hypothetical protein